MIKEFLPKECALLIVDMQRDFCEPGFGAEKAGRDIGPAREVIPKIAELLQTARTMGVLVCHVVFDTLPDLTSSVAWRRQRQRSTVSAERLCLRGSAGAEIIDELAPEPAEAVILKHRYSGFKGTDLELILRSQAVQTCVVVGLSTNVCVESTVRDAFELDYNVIVPRDAVTSWSSRLHDASLETISHRFGTVTTCNALMNFWRGGVVSPESDDFSNDREMREMPG